MDLEKLLEKATEADIERARTRLGLITERRRNAGFDLAAQLEQHLERVRENDFEDEL
jgi:hypothetical protein